jgi:serine/threonine protein kinase/WD40 repeat protein
MADSPLQPDPPQQHEPRPRPSSLSLVQRARIDEFVEGLERGDPKLAAQLRARHPDLASEFDAVEGAWRRLVARLDARRAAPSEYESIGEAADPRISLDLGPVEPGDRRGPGADLLRRIADRSVPPERYRARREIARGGMGSIQRVWDEDLRRYLAMKVMLRPRDRDPRQRSLAPDPRQLRRFLEEVQITGQLDHPGILPVHDLGLDEEGRLYFTMPLVRGQDLGRVIALARAGREGWNRNRVLNVLVRVAEAIAFAHDRGVVHRGIKPENIMVGRFGETYVMDWGLARVLEAFESPGDPAQAGSGPRRRIRSLGKLGSAESVDAREERRTRDGDLVGTPGYMAPEQARGELEKVGPASDIYSLGAVIYQLLTGSRPYDDELARASGKPLVERILEERPTPVERLDPDQPAELVAICEKAMAEAPRDRYDSVLALTEDLRAYLEGHVVRAFETGPAAEIRKWVQRNRLASSIGAAAAVMLLVAGLTLIVQQRRSLDDLTIAKDATEAALAEAEQQRALTAAALAEAQEQRDRAESERRVALDAQRDLEQVNSALELGRDLANRKANEAEQAERLARQRSYVGNVTAASIALRANELTEARRLLESSPPELRRWDWEFLHARLDGSLAAHPLPVRLPTALAVVDERSALVLDAETGLWSIDLESGAFDRRWSLEGEPRTKLAHDRRRGRLWLAGGQGPILGLDMDDPTSRVQLEIEPRPAGLRWGPLALAPDGARLAVGVEAGAEDLDDLLVAVFDTQSGAVIQRLRFPALRSVTTLAWSPDGERIAVGLEDGSLQLWAPSGARPTVLTRPHDTAIVGLSFGADSQRLAVASAADDATVVDTQSGSVLRSLRGHQDGLSDLAFAPFDEFLVTGSRDRGLLLWDGETGEQRGALRGHTAPVLAIGLTPSGSRVVSVGADRTLRTWDPRSPDATTSVPLRPSNRGHWLAFDESRRRMVTPSAFDATLLELTTLEPIGVLDTKDLFPRETWALPDDRGWIAGRESSLARFDPDGKHVEDLLELPVPADRLALSADGRTAVVQCRAREVRDALGDRRRPLQRWTNLRDAPATLLAFDLGARESRDGPWPHGARAAWPVPDGVRVRDLRVSSDGAFAIVACSDGALRMIDLAESTQRAPERTLSSTRHRLERATGRTLRLGYRIARAVTGAGLGAELPLEFAPVTPASAAALSPDDRTAAVGFDDGRIELWPLEGPQGQRTLRSNVSTVHALTFDLRGERLVSGADDGTVRVFDVDLGEPLLRLDSDGAPIEALAFSPDDRDLFTLDGRGTLRCHSTAPPKDRFRARVRAEELRRGARNYLIATLEGLVTASEVLSRFDADTELDPALRERVALYLQAFGQDADRLASDAWEVVRDDEHTPEEYREAYLWILFAQALEPDDPLHQRTLGVANYRIGKPERSLQWLTRSSAVHRRGPRPEELAVIALCHAALEEQEASRRVRAEFEELIRRGPWSRDPVARSFDDELRSLLGPPFENEPGPLDG